MQPDSLFAAYAEVAAAAWDAPALVDTDGAGVLSHVALVGPGGALCRVVAPRRGHVRASGWWCRSTRAWGPWRSILGSFTGGGGVCAAEHGLYRCRWVIS